MRFDLSDDEWVLLEPLMSKSRKSARADDRMARDFERYATTVAAFVRLVMIRIMLRRLAANASS